MTDNLVERLRAVNIVERLRAADVSWSYEGELCACAADRIEKLEAALAIIKGWFPRNISNPHEQIRMMQDYAYAALKEIK